MVIEVKNITNLELLPGPEGEISGEGAGAEDHEGDATDLGLHQPGLTRL